MPCRHASQVSTATSSGRIRRNAVGTPLSGRVGFRWVIIVHHLIDLISQWLIFFESYGPFELIGQTRNLHIRKSALHLLFSPRCQGRNGTDQGGEATSSRQRKCRRVQAGQELRCRVKKAVKLMTMSLQPLILRSERLFLMFPSYYRTCIRG